MTQAPLKQSIATAARQGAAWVTFGNVACAVMQVAQLAVLARLLSPADYAAMAIATAITGFIALTAEFGISSAIIHYRDIDHVQLSTLYWVNVALGAAGGACLLAATPLVSEFYRDPKVATVLHWTAPSLLITSMGVQFRALNQRDMRFRILAVSDMIAAAIATAIAIAAALAGLGVLSLALGLVANATVGTLINAASCWRTHRPGLLFHLRRAGTFLRYGGYLVASQVVNFFVSQADVIALGRLSPASLGYYSAAKQMGSRPMALINPIFNRVAFPALSALQHRAESIGPAYLRGLGLACGLTFPVYAFLFFAAQPVVLVLLGEKWQPAVPILRALAIYFVVIASSNPVGSLLMATGRVRTALYWNLCAAIVVPTVVVASAASGAVTVAQALAATYWALIVPAWYVLVYRTCGLSFRAYFGALARPLAAAFASGIAARVASSGIESTTMSLFVMLTAFCITYPAASWLVNRSFVVELLAFLPALRSAGNRTAAP